MPTIADYRVDLEKNSTVIPSMSAIRLKDSVLNAHECLEKLVEEGFAQKVENKEYDPKYMLEPDKHIYVKKLEPVPSIWEMVKSSFGF